MRIHGAISLLLLFGTLSALAYEYTLLTKDQFYKANPELTPLLGGDVVLDADIPALFRSRVTQQYLEQLPAVKELPQKDQWWYGGFRERIELVEGWLSPNHFRSFPRVHLTKCDAAVKAGLDNDAIHFARAYLHFYSYSGNKLHKPFAEAHQRALRQVEDCTGMELIALQAWVLAPGIQRAAEEHRATLLSQQEQERLLAAFGKTLARAFYQPEWQASLPSYESMIYRMVEEIPLKVSLKQAVVDEWEKAEDQERVPAFLKEMWLADLDYENWLTTWFPRFKKGQYRKHSAENWAKLLALQKRYLKVHESFPDRLEPLIGALDLGRVRGTDVSCRDLLNRAIKVAPKDLRPYQIYWEAERGNVDISIAFDFLAELSFIENPSHEQVHMLYRSIEFLVINRFHLVVAHLKKEAFSSHFIDVLEKYCDRIEKTQPPPFLHSMTEYPVLEQMEIHNYLAALYIAAGNYRRASEIYTTLGIWARPSSTDMHHLFPKEHRFWLTGIVHARSGLYGEALQAAEKAWAAGDTKAANERFITAAKEGVRKNNVVTDYMLYGLIETAKLHPDMLTEVVFTLTDLKLRETAIRLIVETREAIPDLYDDQGLCDTLGIAIGSHNMAYLKMTPLARENEKGVEPFEIAAAKVAALKVPQDRPDLVTDHQLAILRIAQRTWRKAGWSKRFRNLSLNTKPKIKQAIRLHEFYLAWDRSEEDSQHWMRFVVEGYSYTREKSPQYDKCISDWRGIQDPKKLKAAVLRDADREGGIRMLMEGGKALEKAGLRQQGQLLYYLGRGSSRKLYRDQKRERRELASLLYLQRALEVEGEETEAPAAMARLSELQRWTGKYYGTVHGPTLGPNDYAMQVVYFLRIGNWDRAFDEFEKMVMAGPVVTRIEYYRSPDGKVYQMFLPINANSTTLDQYIIDQLLATSPTEAQHKELEALVKQYDPVRKKGREQLLKKIANRNKKKKKK